MRLLLACLLFTAVPGTHQHQNNCKEARKGCPPLRFGVDSSAGAAVTYNGVADHASVSISCPKGERLLDEDWRSYGSVKVECRNGKYVSDDISAEQLSNMRCGCRPTLTRVKESDVQPFLNTFTGIDKAIFTSFGTMKVVPKANGFVVTCACASDQGNFCYLDLAKDYQTLVNGGVPKFLTQIDRNTGKYDLITSSLLTCDENGINQIEFNGKLVPVGLFTCIGELQPFVAFQGLSSLQIKSSTAGATDFPITINAIDGPPLGVTVTCTCKSPATTCKLNLKGPGGVVATQQNSIANPITTNLITASADGKFSLDLGGGSKAVFNQIECYGL